MGAREVVDVGGRAGGPLWVSSQCPCPNRPHPARAMQAWRVPCFGWFVFLSVSFVSFCVVACPGTVSGMSLK